MSPSDHKLSEKTPLARAIERERERRGEKNRECTWNQTADSIVRRICDIFPDYVRRHSIDIEDEADVKDELDEMFRHLFDDVRREEGTPSFAGASSRMDFFLKNESIGIEVKKTRNSLLERELGAELITDKARYSRHPDCKRLICFVYDPERRLRNPNELKELEDDTGELSVKVIVSPKR